MKLLRLAPEAKRLRRIARAWAAGEFTRAEYRVARRQVIDAFEAGNLLDNDDTQPRDLTETTHRTNGRPMVAATSGHMTMVPDLSRSQWSWWVVGVLLCACVFGATTALAAAGEVVSIPNKQHIAAVRARDPNPDTSPRLAVAQVTLDPVEAFSREQSDGASAVIAQTLQELRARGLPGDHGFSAAELAQVGRVLQALGVHEGKKLTGRDARVLSDLVQAQKSQRGVSVVELEEVAKSVQTYAREQGLFLARGFVPAQTVHNGDVHIALMPGTLGAVTVTGVESSMARAQFADLLGQPVTRRAVESRLLALNALPGFKAQATFSPGAETGQTRLNLAVAKLARFSGGVRVDNNGSEAVGKERISLRGYWVGPRGTADVLSFDALASVNPANQRYLGLRYHTPAIGIDNVAAEFAVTSNRFDWEDNRRGSVAPGVEGDSTTASAALTRTPVQTRNRLVSGQVGIAQHRIGWDRVDDQRATVAWARLSGRRVWDASRIEVSGHVRAMAGQMSGEFVGQDSSFWGVDADAFVWHPIDVPWLAGEQRLSARVAGQYAASQLPSTLRFDLGGASINRGFRRNGFVVDRFASVQLAVQTPVMLAESNYGFVSLFADAGYGETLNDLNEGWVNVTSVGLDWRLRWNQQIATRLSAAWPVASKTSGTGNPANPNNFGAVDDEGVQIFWSLQYTH